MIQIAGLIKVYESGIVKNGVSVMAKNAKDELKKFAKGGKITSDARLKKFMDQKQVQDDFVFPKKTLSPLEKARKASREKTNKRGKTTKR